MKFYDTYIELIAINESGYGQFNREIVCIIPGHGLSESVIQENCCKLPIGEYSHKRILARIAYFGYTSLVSHILEGA